MARELISKNATKSVYRDGDKAIKSFCTGFPKAEVLNEALISARIEEIGGINIPATLAVSVDEDGCWSITKDFIDGKTLKQLMDENPDKLDEYMEQMVDLQLTIHSKVCPLLNKLKDKMIRQISDGNAFLSGKPVGVVDERSEIGGCYMGVAQNHLGIRTDILDCCPKAEGMIMLIRSMGPEVIAVDEIGSEEDVRAIEYALHCGCRLIATVHGNSVEELAKKPVFGNMIREKHFGRYIFYGSSRASLWI